MFPADLARPPRSWAERSHNVVRYTNMPRDGHFAAIEAPDLLVYDLLDFARQLRG
jgi:pimeloyl-ACP methyl ester carboxylesterase